MKKKTFHVRGMHCRACQTLIETEVGALDGVNSISVDHQSGQARIEYDEQKTKERKILAVIKKLGYIPGDKANTDSGPEKINKFFLILFPLALLALYLLIKGLGGMEILAELNSGTVGLSLIFIIGLLSSFHCVGMCGGLIVAYSSAGLKNKEKNANNFGSHLLYNLGRLVSYTIIGGILGAFGSFFGINPSFSGLVLLLAGFFMVLMGLSLFTELKWLKRLKLSTPQFVARFLYSNKRSQKPKGPLIIGLLTGFMPCGPLQAMQLYALSSGSWQSGALAMAVYALGTVPLLLLFGGLLEQIKKFDFRYLMKVSGVIVVILGLFTLNRGLVNFGLGAGVPAGLRAKTAVDFETDMEFQEVRMDLTYRGYEPNVLYIEPDKAVRWIINVVNMTGCTDAIMIESLGIHRDLEIGENIIEFEPPQGVSEIKFSCWMRMVWGKFIMADTSSAPGAKPARAEADIKKQGSCGGSCGSPVCGAAQGRACSCGR